MSNNAKLVYSTETGRVCPKCEKPIAKCVCKKQKPAVKRGQVRVGCETKGRKGKGMTVVTGLPLTMDQMRVLAKELKQQCGTGGTVKDGIIEIQGDHRNTIVQALIDRGYEAKRSGG